MPRIAKACRAKFCHGCVCIFITFTWLYSKYKVEFLSMCLEKHAIRVYQGHAGGAAVYVFPRHLSTKSLLTQCPVRNPLAVPFIFCVFIRKLQNEWNRWWTIKALANCIVEVLLGQSSVFDCLISPKSSYCCSGLTLRADTSRRGWWFKAAVLTYCRGW